MFLDSKIIQFSVSLKDRKKDLISFQIKDIFYLMKDREQKNRKKNKIENLLYCQLEFINCFFHKYYNLYSRCKRLIEFT